MRNMGFRRIFNESDREASEIQSEGSFFLNPRIYNSGSIPV